jgi:hypothetical protein
MKCEHCGISHANSYMYMDNIYKSCISCFFKLSFGVTVTREMIYNVKHVLEKVYFSEDNFNEYYENMLIFVDSLISCFISDGC